jgi:hypothetical protein
MPISVTIVAGEAGPTKVFRFGEDAWRCPATADICRVLAGDDETRIEVAVVGLESTVAAEHFVDSPPDAEYVSPWSEWFDGVMRKAAHEYLDASIEVHAAYIDGSRIDKMPSIWARDAAHEVARVCARGALMAYHFRGHDTHQEFLVRVRADIIDRLRGEPGKVVRP